MRKAISLMSGGLDSTLATKMVMDQGVEVIGVHLSSPFGCASTIEKTAKQLGIELLIRDKGEAYLDLLKDPHYGYGRNMNPCVDCRIYMFKIGEHIRKEKNADFIITGEVIGQRPMSQRKTAIEMIDRDSGDEVSDRLLRPLSAHLLKPTLAERSGWVDRDKLLDFSGRKRHAQFELAKKLGIEDYEDPAGGCLLTDKNYVKRLQDFNEYADSETRMAHSELIRVGRHFRLNANVKLIVGRFKSDNIELEKRWKEVKGVFYTPVKMPGPSALAIGQVSEEDQQMISKILSRYLKEGTKEISCLSTKGSSIVPVVEPLEEKELLQIRL